MVNTNKNDVKKFINCFASRPIECNRLLKGLNDMFSFDGGDEKCFYLYPTVEIKSRFEIKLRQSTVNNLWSVVMIENWQSNMDTYKNNLDEEMALKYVLQLLDQEGR